MRVHTANVAFLGVAIILFAGRSIPAQETSHASAGKTNDGTDAISSAVSQLAEELRRHPAQPSKAADRVAGLYMIDVSTGEVTLVADADTRNTFCGSPTWSSDGKRILCCYATTEAKAARLR